MIKSNLQRILNSHWFARKKEVKQSTAMSALSSNICDLLNNLSLHCSSGRGNGKRDQAQSARLLYSVRELAVTEELGDSGHHRVLHFQCYATASRVICWETVLSHDSLYVEMPCDTLPEGSKESFVSLLEYAEEHLKVVSVFV
ncbi:hypothetical protein AAFF_G00425820 [Aldrovandia affinis]|uniref:Uncharacterized protein n=1 Tax=Aldrovandia affinis TaxID=143900 RepID=A0AAD7X050_9TELE|nr:hypothetical protein AAFF_G00425820 [Aldrovandia affinis]